MYFTHNITHCETQGQEKLLSELASGLARLQARKDERAAPLLALPFIEEDLGKLETLAADIRKRFRRVVLAGAGGSSMSARTLLCLQSAFIKPCFHFLENIDPDVMDDVLDNIDVAESCFLVISKSGSTVETLSQFYVLWQVVSEKLGVQKAAEHFIVITTPGKGNPMWDAASELGIRILAHPHDIGGRFSILTNVGLLPAAIAGLDIRALRRGAQDIVRKLDRAKQPTDFAPALGAAMQCAHIAAGRNISVMLPYSERLAGFSAWYRQNWAESLGKNGKGSTPIRALGTTDQHSQLQLYLAGPKDKLFHLILLKRGGTGRAIPVPAREDLIYMQRKTVGDIMQAEQIATMETLIQQGCPVRLFELEGLAEEQVGALLMHFMLEIILTSYLLGVNAYDQPAVEDGKVLARDYLLTGKL